MASSPSDTTVKRHNRHSSGNKSIQRRSTRGPLDISDPNALGPLSPNPPQALSPSQPSPYPIIRSPLAPSQTLGGLDPPTKDFSYLLRPEIYHTLSQTEIPPPFRDQQPPSDTPLSTLLRTGHFRAAAILAVNQLTTSTSPDDHAKIFHLLYIRLACLTLCNATPFAAQEVKALEDLNSSYYREDLGIQSRNLVPWALRIIVVRLQGIGFNDSRKGVMGYYDLAREARMTLARLKGQPDSTAEERQMWEARLVELGIMVASALVEMGDLSGAAHHLSTLKSLPGQPSVAIMKALLYILIGDISAAQSCISQISSENSASTQTANTISALISLSSGDISAAIEKWQALLQSDPGNAVYAQNLAVTLIYTNQMAEARRVLEGLIQDGNTFSTLTMNLSIVYELCTEKSKTMKVALVEKVAGLERGREGKSNKVWEKTNADFRL